MAKKKSLNKKGLFPSIRIISLTNSHMNATPLLCPPDPLKPLPPLPKLDPPPCYTLTCTCDCVGNCVCDFFNPPPPCLCDTKCYCVSKGGKSPETELDLETCTAYSRTFFRLSSDEE